MAPNKGGGLINKVRRMRDAIDESVGANANSGNTHGSHERAKNKCNWNDVEANKNETEVKTTTPTIRQQKSEDQMPVRDTSDYNFPRKERGPKRIQQVGRPDEVALMSSSGQAQCTNAKPLHCNDQSNIGTRIKRETQCKQTQLGTDPRDTYSMPQHTHQTGADHNLSRLTGGPKQAPLGPVQHSSNTHHYRPRQQPICQASKLPVTDTNHHQPHCVYYNPNCINRQQQQQHFAANRLAEDAMSDLVIAADARCKQQQHQRSTKYLRSQQQKDKYLLVEYRPTRTEFETNTNNRCHSSESRADRPNSSSSGKRTTIKFISQLYFLLHLSAILSLLLYHKNLVTSESRWPDDAQQFYSNPSYIKHNANDTNAPTTTTPIVNPLPVPLMLMPDTRNNHSPSRNNDNNIQTISSVVVAPNSDGIRMATANSFGNRRFGRQTSPGAQSVGNYRQQYQYPTPNPDILVRLIGTQHARHVLRYFLSYLLITSLVVLVCLRLFMLCNCQRAKRKLAPNPVEQTNFDQQETNSAIYGFYHRTRLDCTPVLIGSISLGLIQLIVIGLDIAYNFDWLSENHWPANLPFLQFAFVSLLMQYILGKVAEKREQRKSGSLLDGEGLDKSRRRRGDDLGGGVELDDKRSSSISNLARRYNNNREPSGGLSGDSASSCGGLENIALAHLLVTHILLWLMKLNSISLFQVIEQQQQQHHHHGRQHQQASQQHHDQQSISNKLFPIHSPSGDSQSGSGQLPVSGAGHNSDLLLKNIVLTARGSDRDSATGLGHLSVLRNRENQLALPPKPVLEPKLVRHPVATEAAKESGNKSRNGSTNPTIVHQDQQPYQPPLTSNTSHRPPPPPISIPPPDETSATPAGTDEPYIVTTTSRPADIVPVTTTTPEPHAAKPERGHRSTGPLDRLGSLGTNANRADSSEAVKSNSRWAQHSPGLPPGLNVAPTTRAPEALVPLAGSTKPPGQQKPKLSSPLPKRQTAFRQRPPSSVVAGSSVVASIQTASSGTTTSGSTTPTPVQVRNPRQRVRVMIHRVEDPVHLEAPEMDEARRRRAKQAASAATATTSRPDRITHTTMRPFPSVESDPPIVTSTTPSSIRTQTTFRSTTVRASIGPRGAPADDHETQASSSYSLSNNRTQTKTSPMLDRKAASERPAVDEPILEQDEDGKSQEGVSRAGGSDSAELATEEESGNIGDDVEESDVDLDSLLPPVPNYNEEPTSSIDNEDIVVKRPPTKTRSINVVNETVSKKKAFDLGEDAFVFNEAATEMANATVATLTDPIQSISLQPIQEALVMAPKHQQQQQHKHSDRSGPTFADYLMPIVHQYHILIVAILFNMWLDGLQSCSIAPQRTPQATHAAQDVSFSDKRLIRSRDLLLGSCSSSSELETDSCNSRTSGLVAIPIKDKHHRHYKYLGTNIPSGFAIDSRVHNKSSTSHQHHHHWKQLSDRYKHSSSYHHHLLDRHHRSRSMDSLELTRADELLASSSESTLSRRHSLRSSSSQQLLWVTNLATRGGVARSPLLGRQILAPFSLRQADPAPKLIGTKSARQLDQQQLVSLAATRKTQNGVDSSVCSVFFGLIVVSISLIVILVSIDLLSIATQCITQLITIIVCLVGLVLIWRSQKRTSKPQTRPTEKERLCYRSRLNLLTGSHLNNTSNLAHSTQRAPQRAGSHRQCFHYLFLLAAYYCGISVALNLSKQHSLQQMFSLQVIQFIQRHQFGSSQERIFPQHTTKRTQSELSISNYLFLFHLILVIKGLLLILQVTLQTVLIRSSCQRPTRELRQIYTFLMFANLSLWALEICEQQQHLQRDTLDLSAEFTPAPVVSPDERFRANSLDGFTRFAASVVTLSHLYHGLVFMQQ